MHSRARSLALSAAIALTFIQHKAAAQDSPPTGVEPAAFARAAVGAAQRTVKFGRLAPQVGDQAEQSLVLEMRLSTSLRKGKELAQKNQTTMRNQQHRVLTTTVVTGGRAQAATVRYVKATKQLSVDASPGQTVAQPVEGKVYRCIRESGEQGKLMVTDEAGSIPPLDEYEIVAQNMEMIGRPNPLGDFLAGRSVAVGETLSLPKEVADRLFGIGDRFGDVTRLDLTLQEVREENGIECAVFAANVDASSSDSSQMRLQLEGPLVVQIPTCRALRIKLSGPIGMSESRGSYSIAYQLLGTGRLSLSIDASYRDATR